MVRLIPPCAVAPGTTTANDKSVMTNAVTRDPSRNHRCTDEFRFCTRPSTTVLPFEQPPHNAGTHLFLYAVYVQKHQCGRGIAQDDSRQKGPRATIQCHQVSHSM